MPYGQVLVDTVKDSLNNVLAPASAVFRNRIINGAMVIDQRNAGASVTPTSDDSYTLDRWSARLSVASKYSVQQNAGSVTPPVGFTNYLGVTSLSAYSISSSDYFSVLQKIEGFNFADLQWGTANAKTITLSAWVYSSLTGTFGGALSNSAGTRGYPFTYTISSASTWTQISITIAGDTSGTWVGATNGAGVYVSFGLGVGSTYSGTAGAWATSASRILSATGATSVVGTASATFYITGVQLEVGTNATNFEYRPYGTELALCQRYYEIVGDGASATTRFPCLFGYAAAGSTFGLGVGLKVTKRAIPTMTLSGSWALTNCSSLVAEAPTYDGFRLQATATALGTAAFFSNGAGQYITASAEL
jgi:hypothetical protein